ncbi:uncharacterized protein TNCV_916181 [Trichonephila clavipes]|nr:uncharacterized protein TNCV_916181 [Trichonephila clavipes]
MAGLVISSNPVPLKTYCVGQQCPLNMSRAKTSSRWCGVVARRGFPAKVSSTSLDHGSKLRGPSSGRWYPSGHVRKLVICCTCAESGFESCGYQRPTLTHEKSVVSQSVYEVWGVWFQLVLPLSLDQGSEK